MQRVPLVVRIEADAWAEPRPGMTLDELIERLRALGNQVLEVDRDHNRVKVLHVRSE